MIYNHSVPSDIKDKILDKYYKQIHKKKYKKVMDSLKWKKEVCMLELNLNLCNNFQYFDWINNFFVFSGYIIDLLDFEDNFIENVYEDYINPDIAIDSYQFIKKESLKPFIV